MKTFLRTQKRFYLFFFQKSPYNLLGYTPLRGMLALTFVATGFIAIGQSQPSHLGPFQLQLRSQNPLREPIHSASRPNPVAVDLDRDGDRDIVLADFYGGYGFSFLRNDGSASASKYNYAQYYDNPFYYTALGNGGTPAFSDMDRDGDLDMLLGLGDGTIKYYRNNSTRTGAFTQQTGAWNSVTKAGNPFNGVDLGDFAAPVFIDFDKDGDDDLIIGTSYLPNNKSIHYYVNDGEGNFTLSSLVGVNPSTDETTPALLDIDGDGQIDILVGAADGSISFFKRTGPTEFVLQSPTSNPFNGVNKGNRNSPTATDLDADGDADLIFGVENIEQDLFYFENKGNGIFQERTSFDNPFGGITVVRNASPYFIDLNNDGTRELVIASWYANQKLKVLDFTNGIFKEASNNPFSGLTFPNKFYPSFVDIDNDGDVDVIGGADITTGSPIEFYKNESGSFVRQTFANGPFSAITTDESKTDFIDIDADGDYDLFIPDYTTDGFSYNYFLRFFRNTGTKQSPAYTEVVGSQNPLVSVTEQFQIFPRFIDIDHDGDFDAVIGEGGNVVEAADGNEFSLYENIGSVSNPVFKYRGDLIQQGDAPSDPAPSFFDVDNDGDTDMFVGGLSGDLSFYKNNNPAAVISLTSSALNIAPGSSPVAIDANFSLTDADNDSIVFALITIENYQDGRHLLGYTPQAGIDATFNNWTGVLKFAGKAPLSTYQTLLRSLTIEYREPAASGRTSTTSLSFAVTIEVSDADGTKSTPANRSINVVSNQPPLFADQSVSINFGATATVDLKTLITDADNNVDYTTLAVLQNPGSGASATIDSNGKLTVNYSVVNFKGTETISLKVCDVEGACDQGNIAITVVNSSPVFADGSATVSFGKIATVDLSALISDPENNVDWTSLAFVSTPGSGASTKVNNNTVEVDYSAKSFVGTESLTMKVCDKAGACDQSTITINVTNSAPVFNDASTTISFGKIAMVDLPTLISDPESNIDWATLAITSGPGSGASTKVNSSNSLEVNYSAKSFAGTESLTMKICDKAGVCDNATVTITVVNTTPVFLNASATTAYGTKVIVDLSTLVSDVESNLDLNSLAVTQHPASGAVASTDANQKLSVDYTNVVFAGSEQVSVKICDLAKACATSVVTVTVVNTAPVITTQNFSTKTGSTKTIDLTPMFFDTENNIDFNSLTVAAKSGAASSVVNVSGQITLSIDYGAVSFTGTDEIDIHICDKAGSCTNNILLVEVEKIDIEEIGDVEVFNAVAPASSGDNKFMRILNLPTNNHVKIFNRWGDEVFSVAGYDNDIAGKRFEGIGSSGNALTTGTYFYKIEYLDTASHIRTLTGYLSLKQ